jgi:hypothetical protein
MTARLLPAHGSPDEDDDDLPLGSCASCRGPVRLCGGPARCTFQPISALEGRWLSAIRAVYVGIVLTGTEAGLWGGTLLLWARRLAAFERARSGPAALAIGDMAGRHADPGGIDPWLAARLAIAYLERGELDAVQQLHRALGRQGAADWLVDVLLVAPRAARATPLEHQRFALFSVLCDTCASPPGRSAVEIGFDPTPTYDGAIRCSRCERAHVHPLRGATSGTPHPVGRCFPGGSVAPSRCFMHADEGLQANVLDASGLCPVGRATMARALDEAERIGQPVTPADREVLEALERARHVVPAPIVAAVAAIDPDAARALTEIPGVGAVLALAEDVGRALTDGLEKLTGGIADLRALVAPKPRALNARKRRKGKKGDS